MKKLTGGTKELDVLSILFGMPGLVWCAVSQSYNRRTLLVEIFKQATKDKSEIKEDVDIADKLQKALKGKRYLIVLDDIWEDLGLCFPNGEYGSRVMISNPGRELGVIGEDSISRRALSPGSTGSRVTSCPTL
ncbi:hypothetical protein KY285_027541 [Solanum tuberosum]|nr:hypothetical protein KY289_027738 [Solanum tuberosum]KAH0666335.1 hypothetical protein KY285_027541 [Solanum tuberosum]